MFHHPIFLLPLWYIIFFEHQNAQMELSNSEFRRKIRFAEHPIEQTKEFFFFRLIIFLDHFFSFHQPKTLTFLLLLLLLLDLTAYSTAKDATPQESDPWVASLGGSTG